MDLTTVIREAIERGPRSQSALAEEAGVSKAILSRFMRGQMGMQLRTADALVRALGLEVRLVRPRRRKEMG